MTEFINAKDILLKIENSPERVEALIKKFNDKITRKVEHKGGAFIVNTYHDGVEKLSESDFKKVQAKAKMMGWALTLIYQSIYRGYKVPSCDSITYCIKKI